MIHFQISFLILPILLFLRLMLYQNIYYLPTYDAPDVRLEDAKNAVCTSVNLRPVLLLIIRQTPICA